MSLGVKAPGGHGGGHHVPGRGGTASEDGQPKARVTSVPLDLPRRVDSQRASHPAAPEGAEFLTLLSQSRPSDDRVVTSMSLPRVIVSFQEELPSGGFSESSEAVSGRVAQ